MEVYGSIWKYMEVYGSIPKSFGSWYSIVMICHDLNGCRLMANLGNPAEEFMY